MMIWPLYVWKVTSVYPGMPHARIMIEGFLGCFVTGFLGTALPRLLGVPKVSLLETCGCGTVPVAEVELNQPGIGPRNLGDFRSMLPRHRPVSAPEPITAQSTAGNEQK